MQPKEAETKKIQAQSVKKQVWAAAASNAAHRSCLSALGAICSIITLLQSEKCVSMNIQGENAEEAPTANLCPRVCCCRNPRNALQDVFPCIKPKSL